MELICNIYSTQRNSRVLTSWWWWWLERGGVALDGGVHPTNDGHDHTGIELYREQGRTTYVVRGRTKSRAYAVSKRE